MSRPLPSRRPRIASSESGFSLPELMIAVTILLIISSTVTSALLQMTHSQQTINNRTQLHAGVRSATELLQQEVGQAGLITLPTTITLAAAVAPLDTTATLSSVSGIFLNERLLIDAGSNEETVQVTAINTVSKQITISRSVDSTDTTIQTSFIKLHAAGASVRAPGGFVTGVVPPQPGFPNGSTASVLKLHGDINGDGNMVYIEYTCDPLPASGIATATPPGTGNLYRNVIPFDQTTAKAAPTASQVLLSNIRSNPGGTACFTYMPNPLPVVSGDTYVLDVAITLTVQTQAIDPVTRQFQTETKALLNVSPRNVFNVWQMANAGVRNRLQPTPPTVTALLP
jgi:prepilin-type N-terminal cleavage/methylation domain-containing protein